MSERGVLGTLGSVLSEFARFVWLWFGFGLATDGLAVLIDAALVNEPFGWALHASSVVALVAAFVVERYYPDVESGTVWRFGVGTFLAFVALSWPNHGLDPRTQGSTYYVVKTGLVWVGAVAFGWAVARGD